MEYGICLPYMKRGINRQTILDWCKAIEDGPYTSLSCGERITGYTMEMRNTLAFAAAVTERVRICPSLYVLPMHDAAWSAKEIATLDVLSNGRVDLVVGVGGREKDYKAVNADFSRRHPRMDEQVSMMKHIWNGGVPFDGCPELGPDPVQAGGPSILAGVMGPKAMTRASKWADGVYAFSMNGEKHEVEKLLTMADNAWQESGRDKPPRRVSGFWYCLADKPQEKLHEYVYDYMIFAGEEIANMIADSMTRFDEGAINEALDALEELGAEECWLCPATADIAEINRMTELLAKRG